MWWHKDNTYANWKSSKAIYQRTKRGAVVVSLLRISNGWNESYEDDKVFQVLVSHVDKDSGLIAASLLYIPNINSGSTAQQIYDVYRETFSLDRDNCVTYSSDNANPMIGQGNSLLQKIRGVEGDQKIFDLGCPFHLAHLCAGKRDNKLSLNVENFVIDIYHNFTKTEKKQLGVHELFKQRNQESNQLCLYKVGNI